MSNSPGIPDSSVVKECLTTDIEERMRNGEPCKEASGDNHCKVMDARSGCLCAIAADTITALRAEIERLNTLVQTMRYAEDENHLAVLRENERLTAALAKQYSALQWIDQQRYCRRETIQEGNAFEMAKKLNEKLVLIMNRAGDAITGMLEPDNRRLLRKSPPPYVR
jgi:hypothetical protein